jgi:hypothetical protein
MAKLRLPDGSLEGRKEVWVKCPKCGERFRPQRPDLDLELGLAAPVRGPKPERRRQVEEIINRIDLGKMGPRRETDLAQFTEALPVLPEVPQRTWVFMGLTALLVAGLLGALAWIFHSSGAPPPPLQPAAAAPPPDYGRDLLLYDITALRKDLLRHRHVDRRINYRGRESRFYKYYTPILAPDLCQEITALRLWSPRTSEGFTLQGECLNPRDTPAVIEVRWDLRTARIKVAGMDQTVELPLPQPGLPGGQPAAPAAGQPADPASQDGPPAEGRPQEGPPAEGQPGTG